MLHAVVRLCARKELLGSHVVVTYVRGVLENSVAHICTYVPNIC
jgi:hypothetical protein